MLFIQKSKKNYIKSVQKSLTGIGVFGVGVRLLG